MSSGTSKQIVEIEVGERGLGDSLDVLEPGESLLGRRGLGRCALPVRWL
jgi:hypothetical protein